jgi:hypothetical protein
VVVLNWRFLPNGLLLLGLSPRRRLEVVLLCFLLIVAEMGKEVALLLSLSAVVLGLLFSWVVIMVLLVVIVLLFLEFKLRLFLLFLLLKLRSKLIVVWLFNLMMAFINLLILLLALTNCRLLFLDSVILLPDFYLFF